MSAVSLGVLSFLGFDGIATLSEEAKDGRRGPGRAMMASLVIVGALFVLQTYIAGCIGPDGAAFAATRATPSLGGAGSGRTLAVHRMRCGHGAGLGNLHGVGRSDGRVAALFAMGVPAGYRSRWPRSIRSTIRPTRRLSARGATPSRSCWC